MSLFPAELLRTAEQLLQSLRARGLTLCTAESCTGGLISALFTEIPGSSDVFTQGYVTYSDKAKTAMIGVNAALIATHGAVSEAVAIAMAEGARSISTADVAVAVTGIAGPGGARPGKPVGLVHIASARAGHPTLHIPCMFSGDRSSVRLQAVEHALQMIQRQLDQ